MYLRQLLRDGKGSAERALPEAEEEYKFSLDALAPQVVTEGGTVTRCDESNFPVLARNDAAVFLLTLRPGSLREPHWHPNAWELDYCMSGRGRLGVVTPDSTESIVELGPGEVGFVPQGFGHFIENIGDEDMRCVVVFNHSKPNVIGLSTFFEGVPKAMFGEPLV